MLDLHDHAGTRTITLMRAPVNALNPALCDTLCKAITQAVADGCDGIVLAGGAKVFSAGLDVPHLMSLGKDRTALHAAWESFFAASRALAECPIPVAAAITGHAPAGGCVLALCCDHRVMAQGPFQIGLNETQVGLAVPEGIQRMLRRVVGVHRAEQLLLRGAMVDAETALAIGLVDELAAHGDVVAAANNWLAGLQGLPRTPMLRTRAIARADLIEALTPQHIGLDAMLDAWEHPDTQAALKALLAKLGK
ncbi:Enoyl-CoA hydratase/carnithine racemase [Lysobacter silvestris]|uniref:Enoyl-CoA hydratase/carnithine racemase n=2 Tax=Solilutibacter silvestris TaxID=1645665 RepID=A0A2K1PY23_9GAMM|nr:Enoyl-CoA hydratase/carnithine racemase [Lysobacter silvestris]